jgi:molybdenum cofactor cytidylyltransferase
MSDNIAVLILAGGSSSRFGSCKLLAEYQGEALISYSLSAAKKFAPQSTYLLTGAWHQTLVEAAENSDLLAGVKVLHHQDWQQGMGNSIAKGMQSIANNYDAVLIMLSDQPLLTLPDYQQLIAGLDNTAEQSDHKSADISCAFYADKRGVPAVFKRVCFEELLKLSGDRGAQKLLYDDRYQRVEIALPNAAIDIDYPQALTQLNTVY